MKPIIRITFSLLILSSFVMCKHRTSTDIHDCKTEQDSAKTFADHAVAIWANDLFTMGWDAADWNLDSVSYKVKNNLYYIEIPVTHNLATEIPLSEEYKIKMACDKKGCVKSFIYCRTVGFPWNRKEECEKYDEIKCIFDE